MTLSVHLWVGQSNHYLYQIVQHQVPVFYGFSGDHIETIN